jgi:hypothetical protein
MGLRVDLRPGLWFRKSFESSDLNCGFGKRLLGKLTQWSAKLINTGAWRAGI